MRCHSSTGMTSGRPATITPTLLTTTSTAPNSSSTRSRAATKSSLPGDVAPLRDTAVPPAAVISVATVAARSSSTSVTRTREPRAASSWAIARPIPLPAPVTTAAVPSRSKGASSVMDGTVPPPAPAGPPETLAA